MPAPAADLRLPPEGEPPWLLTFVDTLSLLLTFLVVLIAEGAIGGEAWRQTAAAVRDAFAGAPPAVAAVAPAAREAPPPDALAPGYLGVVFRERLAALPLLTPSAPPAPAPATPLRLTLPLDAAFEAGGTALRPAAGEELAVLGRGLADVGNAIRVRVPPAAAAAPDAADGAAGEATPGGDAADDDWRLAVGRALAIGAVLADAGIAAGRLSLTAALAEPGAPAGSDRLTLTIEPVGGR